MGVGLAEAQRIAEAVIRKEAAKHRPAALINIALEKVVEAGLELPGFPTPNSGGISHHWAPERNFQTIPSNCSRR
ncbi:hypothetical protein ACH4FX_40590 [Streptomyces sp. NPDC018019]|uniref:hypothetical protein n=1 Tax=Streptomyces sp. NPDC018019 TaxID=3365030 RepID=UPI0037B14259